MKLTLSLIDLIMVHEGKKTLRYIEKESLKENAVVEDRGSLSKPLVFIQQQKTHALWRDYKLTTLALTKLNQ